jgi:hypothetical protein
MIYSEIDQREPGRFASCTHRVRSASVWGFSAAQYDNRLRGGVRRVGRAPRHLVGVNALGLNQQRRLCDQSLERSFG